MIISLLSGLVIVFISFRWWRAFIPPEIRSVVAATITLVIFAIGYFTWLVTGVSFIFFILAAIIPGCIVLMFSFRSKRNQTWKDTRLSESDLFFILLLMVALVYDLNFSEKWGRWDARAIWSAHARFLMNPEFLKNLWYTPYSWSHPDYPLVLPSLIAMIWKTTGSVSYPAPLIIGFVPVACILLLLFTAGEDYRSGIFASLLLVFDQVFMFHAASQYADVLLAFFYLLSFVIITRIPAENEFRGQRFFLLGIITSSCMWIKNEGNVFYILSAIYVLVVFRDFRRGFFQFLLGSIPVLLSALVYKFLIAQSNDMLSAINPETAMKMMKPGKYLIIMDSFSRIVAIKFPLLPLMALTIWSFRKNRELHPMGILILLLMIYLMVYIIIPYVLQWHLEISLSRMVVQIYPAIVFFFALLIPGTIHPANLLYKK